MCRCWSGWRGAGLEWATLQEPSCGADAGPMETTHWRLWGRYVVVAVAAATISFFAFVLRSPVPIFDWVDLGIHELGHMLVMSGPRMLHFLAGSLAQVTFPAGLAVYFLWRQQDRAAAGFCLAWAGTSMWDVSVYIADAPVQALPLIGGGTHDWAYLLGPQGWDAIDRAGSIAGFVDLMGMAAAITGIGMAVWPAVVHATEVVRFHRAPIRPAPAMTIDRHMASDPLRDAPERAFPSAPSLADEEGSITVGDETDDPWTAAAHLPFFHDSDRAT